RSSQALQGLARLRAWTIAEHRERAGSFALRKSGGFVREGHGDLHLGNVALLEDEPVLFDCIEFDERYRWIDVMSDVAFTAMDLAHHGLPRFAARFLNRYLEETGDYSGLAVLRFYLVYRAMVRAKIAAIRGQWEVFDDYLRLALRLSARAAPVLVAMHGLSGAGKTTASQELLEAMGAIRVRSDIERKRAHGLPALSRTGAGIGEGLYADDGTRRTYTRLATLASEILAAGFAVIVDAACLRRWQRDALRETARRAGAAFEIASCVAPEPLLHKRLERRSAQARDASDAGIAVLESQLASQEPLGAGERMHALFLDTASEIAWTGAIESFARRFRAQAE
ncbi:MAG: AAA family ATPase, partial [Usitatibacter sp.]